MLGLALEGGGAKGSFQTGAIRALLDNGYAFDGVVGSSIGCLNGAMLVQGDFDKSYEIWNTMEFSRVFDFEDKYAAKLAQNDFDKDTVKYLMIKLKETIKNGGLDTTKIKKMIDYYIDEEKIRKSAMDFGLMTLSFSDMKPCALFKEDIPYGKMADYVMASANFPGFKKKVIDDKVYVDGGLYDNLPINMLVDRGYRDIIAIPLRGFFSFKKKVRDKTVNVQYIMPSEKPGRMLDFNNSPVNRGLEMGYLDGSRFVKGYIGSLYYVEDIRDYAVLENKIMAMDDIFFMEMSAALSVVYTPNKIVNINAIYEKLNKLLDIKSPESVAHTFIALVEKFAYESNMERLELIKMRDLVSGAYDAFVAAERKAETLGVRKRLALENAFVTFCKHYKD